MGILDDFLDMPREDINAVCAVCGFPLPVHLVAADFSGTVICYTEHVTIPVSFCMCAECFTRITEFTNGGADEAYRRLYASAVITRQREKELKESTE